ncbi:MAG: hypothetical protein DCC65_08970 [Planctomycetota bacterium]|nr:MAG: hypothetical protein DCC65_08970 [Planctomycetota bacterium]
MSDAPSQSPAGGIVHTYLGYDPQRFPMPASQAPDLVTPAFEHLLESGTLRDFSEEELAEAIELDPSQISGLGPSVSSLLAMLEERKRRILETYEVSAAREESERAFLEAGARMKPPKEFATAFQRALKTRQIAELERMWYRADNFAAKTFAKELLTLIETLGNQYEVEQLAGKYRFSGKKEMTVPQAIEIKEELETIDRLIEQLKEAARNAKLYLINMEELARFADRAQMAELERLRHQVEELVRQLAEEQGLQNDNGRYTLTPRAFRIFQSKLLDRIFADLQAAKTGRHSEPIAGEGVVETQRTRPYAFGDSLANMDVASSMTNAMIREASRGGGPGQTGPERGPRIRMLPEDIEIHITRNTPKCATVVCMDMSGSMRWGGQYVNVKRMALALHGLIRTEYPGDFVDFVEIFTFAKRRHISEVPQLMPKTVTIHEPWVRLKADMSDERLTERDIPPHFTNLQQGLRTARQILQVQDTPNRQIILITDGLPTAHFEDKWLYLLYPPDPRTEHFTQREGLLCREQNITINIFLLSGWSQSEEDIRFANRLAEGTQGRVFFVGGRELDRYVVWDYLKRRRYMIK